MPEVKPLNVTFTANVWAVVSNPRSWRTSLRYFICLRGVGNQRGRCRASSGYGYNHCRQQ